MSDKLWKEAERRSAEFFTGSRERTGPTGRDLPDFPSDTLGPEVKSRKRLPAWLWDAVEQSEENARGKMPFVHLIPRRIAIEDTLIVVRAGLFRDLLRRAGML